MESRPSPAITKLIQDGRIQLRDLPVQAVGDQWVSRRIYRNTVDNPDGILSAGDHPQRRDDRGHLLHGQRSGRGHRGPRNPRLQRPEDLRQHAGHRRHQPRRLELPDPVQGRHPPVRPEEGRPDARDEGVRDHRRNDRSRIGRLHARHHGHPGVARPRSGEPHPRRRSDGRHSGRPGGPDDRTDHLRRQQRRGQRARDQPVEHEDRRARHCRRRNASTCPSPRRKSPPDRAR